jgi:sugar lactone lactonase YvrE
LRHTPTRLIGTIKLIAQPGAVLVSDRGGGIISDRGGGLISDQGGGIISNTSGQVLSNNGGAVVSSNGGSMLGKTKFYGLQDAAGLAVYGLADARVELLDAAGRALQDEEGRPLQAVSGPDASYRLEAALPPGNLVARVTLWNGGELRAIIARDNAQQATVDITTASSLGAAYVLDLARGDQATLDKLPRSENDQLSQQLDVVRAFATGAFLHDNATLNAITGKLRQRVPAVDRIAEAVEALLLGQARLGAGRPATEVPLIGAHALYAGPTGLLIGERHAGRIRRLVGDGTLQAVLDRTFGSITANHPGLLDVVEAPDGTLYFTQENTFRVFRAPPGQLPAPFLGSGEPVQGPVAAPVAMGVVPRALALGPDGTLWVGEGHGTGRTSKDPKPPRVLAVRPGGAVEAFEDPAWQTGEVIRLAATPDGTVWVLQARVGQSRVCQLRQGRFEPLGEPFRTVEAPALALGPDGRVVVSQGNDAGLFVLGADGSRTPLPEGEALRALGLEHPRAMAFDTAGTLYVASADGTLVGALTPGGSPRLVAGTRAVFQTGDGQAFAINGPGGLAVDQRQRLYISEIGRSTVRVFDGTKLEPFAGSTRGYAGDGGPALQARLFDPRGIAFQGDRLWILDAGNGVLRRVEPDGTIHTAAPRAEENAPQAIPPGASVEKLLLYGAMMLTAGPEGEPIWSETRARQVQRLDPGGALPRFRSVLGAVQDLAVGGNWAGLLLVPPTLDAAAIRLIFPCGVATAPDGALYVSDAVANQIYRVRGHGTASPVVELVAGLHVSTLLSRHPQEPLAGQEEGADARTVDLAHPLGLACDEAGNLYVTEAGTSNLAAWLPALDGKLPFDPSMLPQLPARVRRISPAGTITTVAGPGGRFLATPGREAGLVMPTGVACFRDGRLAIADSGSNLIHILPAARD